MTVSVLRVALCHDPVTSTYQAQQYLGSRAFRWTRSCECVYAQRPGGILGAMGLPLGSVRNVMMPRDIVPRAFACDYTLVADLLKRVGPSFREHRCLSGGPRVVLYYAIGKQLMLQPPAGLTFVRGEGYHPLFPQETGLFIIEVSAHTRLPTWLHSAGCRHISRYPKHVCPAPVHSPCAHIRQQSGGRKMTHHDAGLRV